MEKVEILIIGAGVIGLGVAAWISGKHRSIFVVEKNRMFGQETSSRNSEVIHAGIYYPKDSLKAELCVKGNRMLYEICEKSHIKYKRLGKLIVATKINERERLEELFEKGKENGVTGLQMLTSKQIKDLEPEVEACSAIYSPNTGIIDSHGLMKYFLFRAEDRGVNIVYNTEVKNIEKDSSGYRITVSDRKGRDFTFITEILINCAGLNSDKIAGMVGMNVEECGYRLKYCKGEYFRIWNNKANLVKRPIYPVVKPEAVSLGIHVTPDLNGAIRLGPDATYIHREKLDYSVDISKKRVFYEYVKNFLPFIAYDDLNPDIAGIRPKLQGAGEAFRDFVIQDEKERGFAGFINLIGIESPGLTSAPAIAEYVNDLLKS